MATWRRATAVLGYLAGKSVLAMTTELHVSRSAINDWLRWYDSAGGRVPRARHGERRANTPDKR